MTSEEILARYRASYDAPQPFDPKHPEDVTLSRREEGLPPLPMNAEETAAVCDLLSKGDGTPEMLDLLENEVEPGTGAAAKIKADFLGKAASGEISVSGLSADKAIELLERMKGGHNVPVLVGLLENGRTAARAREALSRSVLIHNAVERVGELYKNGNKEAESCDSGCQQNRCDKRLVDPVELFGTVVIPYDRLHTLIEAHHNHYKYECDPVYYTVCSYGKVPAVFFKTAVYENHDKAGRHIHQKRRRSDCQYIS